MRQENRGVFEPIEGQAPGLLSWARRVVIGAKKTSIILADKSHTDIVRVNRGEVNIKFVSQ